MRIAALALLGSLCCTGAYAQAKTDIVYDIRVKDPDPWWMGVIKEEAGKMPGIFRARINEAGGKMIVFEGCVTDNPELKEYKGKTDAVWNFRYDDLDGIYDNKKAFVRDRIYRYPGSVSVPLHEEAHMVDDVFGRLSALESFRKLLPKSGNFYGYDFREPRQVWAEGITRFLNSDVSRQNMESDFPGIYSYFASLEKNVIIQLLLESAHSR